MAQDVSISLTASTFFRYHIFHPNQLTSESDRAIALISSIALGVFTLGLFHLFCFLALYDRHIAVKTSPDELDKKTADVFDKTLPVPKPAEDAKEEKTSVQDAKEAPASLEEAKDVPSAVVTAKEDPSALEITGSISLPKEPLPPSSPPKLVLPPPSKDADIALKPKKEEDPDLLVPEKKSHQKTHHHGEAQSPRKKKVHHHTHSSEKLPTAASSEHKKTSPTHSDDEKGKSDKHVTFKLPKHLHAESLEEEEKGLSGSDEDSFETGSAKATPRSDDESSASLGKDHPHDAAKDHKTHHKAKKPEPKFVPYSDNSKVRLDAAKQWAEEGQLEYQKFLGSIYLFGRFEVPRSRKQAFYWYSKAAQQNDSKSLYRAGKLLRLGWGVHKDEEKGLGLITKAKELGNHSAEKYLKKHFPDTKSQ